MNSTSNLAPAANQTSTQYENKNSIQNENQNSTQNENLKAAPNKNPTSLPNQNITLTSTVTHIEQISKLVPNSQGQKKIIVVGQTGNGKSSLFNAIAGKYCFKESPETQSETSFISHVEITIKDQPLLLIDTPGFLDSEGRDAHIILSLIKFFKELERNNDSTLNQLLFTFNINEERMNKAHQNNLTLINMIFGTKAFQYIKIVLTQGNKLKDDIKQEKIQRWKKTFLELNIGDNQNIKEEQIFVFEYDEDLEKSQKQFLDSQFFENIPEEAFQPEIAEHLQNINEDMSLEQIMNGIKEDPRFQKLAEEISKQHEEQLQQLTQQIESQTQLLELQDKSAQEKDEALKHLTEKFEKLSNQNVSFAQFEAHNQELMKQNQRLQKVKYELKSEALQAEHDKELAITTKEQTQLLELQDKSVQEKDEAIKHLTEKFEKLSNSNVSFAQFEAHNQELMKQNQKLQEEKYELKSEALQAEYDKELAITRKDMQIKLIQQEKEKQKELADQANKHLKAQHEIELEAQKRIAEEQARAEYSRGYKANSSSCLIF